MLCHATDRPTPCRPLGLDYRQVGSEHVLNRCLSDDSRKIAARDFRVGRSADREMLPGLPVAFWILGDIGDEVAFFILLNDDGEWVGALGYRLNYTLAR